MSILWVHIPQVKPPLVAQFVFSEGDYHHALECFYKATDWGFETGAMDKNGFYARVYPPHHDKCPHNVPIAPRELIGEPGWFTLMDIHCTPEVFKWFMEQPVPATATRFLIAEDTQNP